MDCWTKYWQQLSIKHGSLGSTTELYDSLTDTVVGSIDCVSFCRKKNTDICFCGNVNWASCCIIKQSKFISATMLTWLIELMDKDHCILKMNFVLVDNDQWSDHERYPFVGSALFTRAYILRCSSEQYVCVWLLP